MSSEADEQLTVKELAERWGVAPRKVYGYVRRGMPGVINAADIPRRYSLKTATHWVEHGKRSPGRPSFASIVGKRHEEQKALAQRPSSEPKLDTSGAEGFDVADMPYDQVRLEREKWAAFKLKIHALQLQGKLVPVEDVRAERLARIHAVKAELASIPSRLASRVIAMSEKEAEKALRHAINAACDSFAREPDQAERAAS